MTTRRHRPPIVLGAALAALALLAACTPAPPAAVDWSFRATSILSVDSQDEVRVFGACVAIPNCDDEAYLYQIAFRARIGEPGSAQAWVVRGDEVGGLSEGERNFLSGGQQARVDFPGVRPLDVLDALDPANKFEIVGVYTWAAESDTINSLAGGASSVAGLLRDALNSTLASQQVPDGDAPGLIDLILDQLFNNFGSTFRLVLSNIPCLGLCDDVLGGRVYLGLGATGALAQTLDPILAGVAIPSISTGFSVPPGIQGGGIFTLGGERVFGDQSFVGADGHHQYSFVAGPAA